MYSSLIVFLLVSVSTYHAGECDSCLRKTFQAESFVCVCNETYCDDLEVTINPSDRLIYSFTSDKDEKRFDRQTFKPEDLVIVDDENGDSIVLSINVDDLKQQIIGFGGSFTDASGINIKSLPADLQLILLSDYFGSRGLEYNMGRVCVAGSDFSTHPYTYQDEHRDLEWSHFALTREDFDYKIPYIKMANELSGGLKLFGSMWSPPAWMKYQERINGTGVLQGDPGGPYYHAMATYLVKFLDEYKKNGIEFWGLTTLNEPSAGFKPNYRFNSLGVSAEMFREWIALDLGPVLEAAGYGKDKLKLMIVDDNVSLVVLYASRILGNGNSSKYVSGIAIHWYEHEEFGYDAFEKAHEKWPEYFILSTEACDGVWADKGVKLGGWDRGENYASDIIEALNHWGTGWVDWNLALDMIGGPNWVSNFVDAPIIVNAEAREYYKQPTYYALAHFTKFLKPGSTRLGVDVTNEDEKVKSTVFRNTEDQIVIVSLNRNDHAVNITISGATQSPIGITLDGHSVQTIVINKSNQLIP